MKDCAGQSCVCDKVVFERDGLTCRVDVPGKGNVDITKRHACHANRTSMSPSATPATQSAAAPRATNGDQARHQTQPRVWKLWQVLGAQFFETIVLMKFVLKTRANSCTFLVSLPANEAMHVPSTSGGTPLASLGRTVFRHNRIDGICPENPCQ